MFFSLPIMGAGEEGDSLYTTYVKLGLEALMKDSLTVAESHFREAMQLDPTHRSNYMLFRYIGRIQERQEMLKEALESYTAGLSLNPKSNEMRLDRAALYYRMGNNGRALNDYSDVLDEQPENMEARLMRAHI